MKFNQKFFNDIKPILEALRNRAGDDFIVFGSVPLYLLGIVKYAGKINDIDIALKNKADLPANAEVVTFQGNQDQKFHKININGVNIDIGCEWEGWPGQNIFFKKLFKNPIIVEGFKFVNLNTIEEWKKEMVKKYNRDKDKIYLQKIKEFKSKQKNEQ